MTYSLTLDAPVYETVKRAMRGWLYSTETMITRMEGAGLEERLIAPLRAELPEIRRAQEAVLNAGLAQ